MEVKRKKEKERRALTSLMCRKVEDESSHTPKARRLSLKLYADRRTNHRTVHPRRILRSSQLLLLSRLPAASSYSPAFRSNFFILSRLIAPFDKFQSTTFNVLLVSAHACTRKLKRQMRRCRYKRCRTLAFNSNAIKSVCTGWKEKQYSWLSQTNAYISNIIMLAVSRFNLIILIV